MGLFPVDEYCNGRGLSITESKSDLIARVRQ